VLHWLAEAWTAREGGDEARAQTLGMQVREAVQAVQDGHKEESRAWSACASAWLLAMQIQTRDPWGCVGSLGRAIEAMNAETREAFPGAMRDTIAKATKLAQQRRGN